MTSQPLSCSSKSFKGPALQSYCVILTDASDASSPLAASKLMSLFPAVFELLFDCDSSLLTSVAVDTFRFKSPSTFWPLDGTI